MISNIENVGYGVFIASAFVFVWFLFFYYYFFLGNCMLFVCFLLFLFFLFIQSELKKDQEIQSFISFNPIFLFSTYIICLYNTDK